jgi:predicted SAM-dependent methyltransferase
MKLLNLGCGGVRPGEPWVNVDNLIGGMADPGEPNFVIHDIALPLPFADASFDGCLLSHILEHFDAQEGLRLMKEAYRVLAPGGVVLVSVPDASYFRKVYPEDRNENWPRLFDADDPPNPIPTFFEAALWFNEHKAILTEDSLWAYFTMAGFSVISPAAAEEKEAYLPLRTQTNRHKISVEMIGVK